MLKKLVNELNQIVLGKNEVVRLAVSCLLAGGHLLLEDIPGMGKTTLSQALAHLTGMQYRRIQFTSDLLPSDLLGVSIFNVQEQCFHFHPGPIFSQLILADEINRAPPKTQSALLEAMEEHQVTTDAGTHILPEPFFVIATQNPSHQTGTYLLPESQLDRFLMRLSIGYPPKEAERQLLTIGDQRKKLALISPILKPQQLITLQEQSLKITVSAPILDYIQAILHTSRINDWFNHGLSPRAGRALVRAAQAYACVEQRDFVRPEDVQTILPAVVNHRLILRQSEGQLTPAERLLNHVEVPV
ncbi:AAA family ATPase [Legionella oakridgensis]|uniref:MoxR-like ATPase n=2 Tax=Legionella oakridgensis TaxID=29423 RepID=W0BBX2_9GAMM|nr:MoxR family ATPase [Legionella oakridgensis]AHE68033.1 MoxR-like ATPase [Legionella oakridgensis ATCC 33761 = DSM 21215]ETO92461.1 MoxR-like ATPase [Legionella oakridgensis RV-2-2007]KTD44567.1 methanol dehydrogenase regulatory protein [Legionella oakridgensis]STY21022.1 methanol dehydrogenase regulatory protein [Legionella longbeachae]